MYVFTSRKGTEPSLTFGLGRIYQSAANAVYLKSLVFVGEYVFFDIGLYNVEQALPTFIPALFLSCSTLRYSSIVMDNKRHDFTFVCPVARYRLAILFSSCHNRMNWIESGMPLTDIRSQGHETPEPFL